MRLNSGGGLPFIDRNVEHVGVSRLRQLDGKKLKENVENKALVISDRAKPLAVLFSYEQYLIMQDQLNSVMEALELLSDAEETKLLIQGLRDTQAGRTKSLAEIRQSLKEEGD